MIWEQWETELVDELAVRLDGSAELVRLLPHRNASTLRVVISRVRAAKGIAVKRGPPEKPALRSSILTAKRGGESLSAIARRLGVTKQAVSYHYRKSLG